MSKVQFDFPCPDAIESIHVKYRGRHPREGWVIGCEHDVKEWDSIGDDEHPTMQPLEASQQQPCVPIQFVWEDGTLSHIDAVNAESWILFENCEVEQIGAVLYVRCES